jgi:hypothetical protein
VLICLEKNMKIVVRFTAKQEAKALPIILRHSPGTILPDRTYILSEEALQKLRDAGIGFTEISRDSEEPSSEGVGTGERI